MRVLGIAGSLRKDSWNRKLLLAAAELLPEDVELEIWDGLKAVPPYDEDDDGLPAPPPVAALREAIAGADAVLVATPEYNSSVPGQLKNALDWARGRSRRMCSASSRSWSSGRAPERSGPSGRRPSCARCCRRSALA